MQKKITTGAAVKFDSEHGTQRGIVERIIPSIGEGPSVAVVHVNGTQDGTPWNMPVNELQLDKAAA